MPRPVPLVLALATAALTACSTGTPADTAPSTATSPLSVDRLRQDPCAGLTAGQAAALGLAPGKSIGDVGQGATCLWAAPGHGSNVVYVSLDALGGGGIDAVRASRADHAYHEEVEVGGHPAVFASSADQRPEGGCALWVGVSDGLVMSLGAALPEGPDAADPCSAGKRIAAAVVGNLGTVG